MYSLSGVERRRIKARIAESIAEEVVRFAPHVRRALPFVVGRVADKIVGIVEEELQRETGSSEVPRP